MDKKFSAPDAATFGWEKVKGFLGFFVLLSLVLGVVSMIVDSLTGLVQPDQFFAFMIAQLISLAVSGIITLGVAGIALAVTNDLEPKVDQFFEPLDKFMNWFIATILMMLAVVAGFVLLIIPGIIVALKLQFYTYYIVDKNMSAMDALKASWNDTRGQLGQLFVWMLISIALVILGALALLVGLLVTMPIVGLGTAWIYRQVSGASAGAIPNTMDEPAPGPENVSDEQSM